MQCGQQRPVPVQSALGRDDVLIRNRARSFLGFHQAERSLVGSNDDIDDVDLGAFDAICSATRTVSLAMLNCAARRVSCWTSLSAAANSMLWRVRPNTPAPPL
jgi:hypothetical protein